MEIPKHFDQTETSIIEGMQRDFSYLASRNIEAAKLAVLSLMQKLEECGGNLPKRNERIQDGDKKISLNFRGFIESKIIESNILALLNGLKFVFQTNHEILDEVAVFRIYDDKERVRSFPEYYFTTNHKRVKKLKGKQDNEVFKSLKEESEKIFTLFKNLKDHEIAVLGEDLKSGFSLVKKEGNYMVLFTNATYSLEELETKKFISDLDHLVEALGAFKVII